MADRAVGKGDPDGPREVFELDKDERWQARLEDARARREIALREKAAGKPQPKRPKPWETDGEDAPPPIEPIIQERGDDKFDFADRLEQLREPETAESGSTEARRAPEPEPEPEITRATRRPKPDRPPAAEAIERLQPPAPPEPPRRPPAGEAIENLRPPAAAPEPPQHRPSSEAYDPPPRRRARAAPSLILPGAPDVAELASRYADSLRPSRGRSKPPPRSEPEHAEPDRGPDPEPAPRIAAPVAARRSWQVRFPHLTTRPGIRPLGMAWGLLALSALPLTTVAPPLQKGPRMPVIAPFAAPPALGVTWSLYTRPEQTRSGEWQGTAAPAALSAPVFDPPAALLRSIAAPEAPLPGAETVGVPATADAPLADPAAIPGLGNPEARIDPPEAADAPPPADEAALRPDIRPAPARARAEAPPPAAPEPAAAPPDNPLRVTILTPPRADKRVAEELAADVPARGHQLVRILEVDQPIGERNLRFFHESDRAEAARLARDYDAELRDFTWFRPQPLPGTTELWLSGGSDGSESAAVVPPPAAAPEEELPFVVIRPVEPDPRPANDSLLNRVMEGVGNAFGNSLGLPRRGN